MDLHACPDCGLTHSAAGERPESDEVKIARLNKERDVEIARLSRSEMTHMDETAIEVAEIEAGAQVDTAEAIAPAIAAAGDSDPEPDPVPVVVEGDGDPEPEPEPELPDVEPPPLLEDTAADEPPAKPRGMWAGYQ